MEKQCTKCGKVADLTEFYNQITGKHGKTARCKDCIRVENRERARHPSQRKQVFAKIVEACN